MQPQTETAAPAALAAEFRALADQWQAETGLLSSPTQIAAHPAHRQIIQMGPPALPLILQEMQRQPGHWSLTLRAITGENPAPPAAAGYTRKIAAAWLEWGRRNGYLAGTNAPGKLQSSPAALP